MVSPSSQQQPIPKSATPDQATRRPKHAAQSQQRNEICGAISALSDFERPCAHVWGDGRCDSVRKDPCV